MINKVSSPWGSPARPNRQNLGFCPKGVTHSLTHSLIASFCRAGLLCLLFTAILSFTHCSSDDNGGSGGGGDPAVYTCTNGTPSEGSPDGADDVESCASCNAGYTLSDERCNCTPSPKELWTAQLTVGEYTLIGAVVYGYTTALSLGGLSETEFTHKGVDYVISTLARDLSSGKDILTVTFAPSPGNDLVSSWTLDLGSSGSFALNGASLTAPPGAGYEWTGPGFNWADGEMHTVRLLGNTCDD